MFPGNTKEKQALSRPMQQLLIETENLKHETKKREEIAKKHDFVYVTPISDRVPIPCWFCCLRAMAVTEKAHGLGLLCSGDCGLGVTGGTATWLWRFRSFPLATRSLPRGATDQYLHLSVGCAE